MRRTRVAASMIVLAVLVSGCGAAQEQIARETTPSASAAPPNPALAQDDVVGLTRPSVLKIRAEARSCNKLRSGTGFVVGPGRVVTNAHVVAGAEYVAVEVGDTKPEARVVAFDPNEDIAVLDVPGLSAPPLILASYAAGSGAEALMLGYPGAGPFEAIPAVVRERTTLNGPNIYQTSEVSRSVYNFDIGDGLEIHGASGSPLIDMNGRVLGVVFGNEVQNPATGFALASLEVAGLIPGNDRTDPVATGACIN